MKKGDLLVIGRIYTGRRYVGCVVVKDGMIAFSGSRESAEKEWECARRIECEGVVIPGLIDSHMHLAATGQQLIGVDLKGCRSISEMTGRVSVHVMEQGFAVEGGWDHELFSEGRYPTAADLDRISADRPIILYRFCSHAAVVNTQVLKLAGVTAETPDPQGGIIGRDRSGNPDGMFFDAAIEKHIYPVEAALTSSTLEKAVERAAEYAVGRGLTTLVAMNADLSEVEAIRKAVERRSVKCRVRIFLSRDAFESPGGIPRFADAGLVRIAGLKLFADGAFGAHTALLSAPYSDMETCGLPLMPGEEMEKYMNEAARKGLIVAVHAIGDKAAEVALSAASRAGLTAPKVRLEHAALTPENVLLMLSKVRPALAVQPHFLVGDWWLGKRLGERCSSCYLFSTYMSMGLIVAGSSDSPVEPLDPWTGMHAAMDRGASSSVEMARLTASEAIDAHEALSMYMVNGGYAAGEGDRLGSLEQGAYADAVFLENRELDLATVENPEILATMVGGKFVYSSGDRLK